MRANELSLDSIFCLDGRAFVADNVTENAVTGFALDSKPYANVEVPGDFFLTPITDVLDLPDEAARDLLAD